MAPPSTDGVSTRQHGLSGSDHLYGEPHLLIIRPVPLRMASQREEVWLGAILP